MTTLTREQAIAFSQLTGIPLGALTAGSATNLSELVARQRASLAATLSDPRAYVRQRAQQGLDVLNGAPIPNAVAPISYTASSSSSTSSRTGLLALAALAAAAVLGGRRA